MKEVIVRYADNGYDNAVGEIVGELVRCGECMWWKPVVYSNGEGGMVCVQTPLEPATKPDDFCSHGERRTDEHTD